MENATRALTMAASVLIGILIITLMITLFTSGAKAGHRGDKETERIEIEQFNVNFTKYIGKELTIYDVVTIFNLKESLEKTTKRNINIKTGSVLRKYANDIATDSKKNYELKEIKYDSDGFINEIKIEEKLSP